MIDENNSTSSPAVQLKAQWQRLILPPAEIPLTGGEQLAYGNRYPNAHGLDLDAHLAGRKTYAVDLVWRDPESGTLMARAGVLDIDEGPEASPVKAARLAEMAQARGLTVARAHSGGKGCHVWIFVEPAPVAQIAAVLRQLKDAVPFQGEVIPGDNRRVKLAPGFHQVAQAWAFFYAAGAPGRPPADIPPPAAFIDDQIACLAVLEPAPAARLAALAAPPPAYRDPADLVPDLSRLHGAPPPCIAAFLQRGGSPALGTYDKNALTLARYAKTAGVSPEARDALFTDWVERLAPDIETRKSRAEQQRHWEGIQTAPTLEAPFSCAYLLAARQSLGFDCRQCPVRPAGITVSAESTASPPGAGRGLESALADSLVAWRLQGGVPSVPLPAAVFPLTPVLGAGASADSNTPAPLHGWLWQAAEAGCTTPVAIVNWLAQQPYERLINAPPRTAARIPAEQQARQRHVLQQEAAALAHTLCQRPALADSEADALVARAADLAARQALHRAAETLVHDLYQGQGVLETLYTFRQATERLASAGEAGFGAPLAAYAPELLEGLIATERPTVPTPFPYLNTLLAGGLLGGRLYVLGAPPGSGKTTLAAQLADAAAAAGIPVAFVALEMGRGQLFDYALARLGGMNSAKVEARGYQRSAADSEALAAVADTYLRTVAPNLAVIEGDYFTTAARLAAWAVQARARYGRGEAEPLLVVVDYLQLLNTGNESLDNQPNETLRLSQVAVQLKQLARETNAAVLALSDITKLEQGEATRGREFTLNALRGSNRIAHAADAVLVLYSEPGQAEGGKADKNPWEVLADRFKGHPRALDFQRGLEEAVMRYRIGGEAAAGYARLELLKNRGGRGRGNQLLYYERAYHRFQAVAIPGQDAAEGKA